MKIEYVFWFFGVEVAKLRTFGVTDSGIYGDFFG